MKKCMFGLSIPMVILHIWFHSWGGNECLLYDIPPSSPPISKAIDIFRQIVLKKSLYNFIFWDLHCKLRYRYRIGKVQVRPRNDTNLTTVPSSNHHCDLSAEDICMNKLLWLSAWNISMNFCINCISDCLCDCNCDFIRDWTRDNCLHDCYCDKPPAPTKPNQTRAEQTQELSRHRH